MVKDPLKVAGWSLIRTVAPSLPLTCWSNLRQVADPPDGKSVEEHAAQWQTTLVNANQRTFDTVAVIFQTANARIGDLETKAIGLLGVVSIVAAGAFVACTGPLWAAVVGLVGLVYVVSAAIACCLVVIPRARTTLLLEDSTSPSGGYAEMAATTRLLEPVGIRISNLVTSATYDLMRSGLLIFIALLILVAGWGR
jgi:hypothetical protein